MQTHIQHTEENVQKTKTKLLSSRGARSLTLLSLYDGRKWQLTMLGAFELIRCTISIYIFSEKKRLLESSHVVI